MKQLLEWADNIRKSSMITDPTVQLQPVPEDEPMEDATDGAATGHSLEQFLSESVEAARPGLEQMTQLLRPNTDHEMASASSSRATAPTASRTTTHAQTRGQTRQQRLQQERADAERQLNDLEAANEEMAKCFRETKLSDDEHDKRDPVSTVTAQLGSQAGRQSLLERVAEARREAKGKRTRKPRVVSDDGLMPIARHSELYRQVMQMLSMYACLSEPEKHAMQTAGQISEETLQILALALNEEDMAHQPVRDMSTQTYAEHTVQPYSLRSLLDATIRLHNQRLGHEQQWLRNPEYFKLDDRIIIEEVGKANNYLDPGDRQDVTISSRNLQEPSDDNDMLSLQTLIARWPLILVGEDASLQKKRKFTLVRI